MATGRMLQKKIVLNKAVHELSSDTCRLAFTWTIPNLDKNGCIHGDPATLKSIIFPRRDDISATKMEGFIKEWVHVGLVIWYEADGDKWLNFPGFPENQPGLRSDREPDSGIPLPEDCRMLAGKDPADSPPKRKEKKRKEGKELYTDEFEFWYEGYPRKQNKIAAAEKFQQVLKDGVTVEELIKARDNYAAQVKDKDPEYTMHAKTFLRERWREYLTTSVEGGKSEEIQPPKICPKCGKKYIGSACTKCGWSRATEEAHGSL